MTSTDATKTEITRRKSRAALLAMWAALGAAVGCGGDDDLGPVLVAQALIAAETPRLLVARREVPPAAVRRIVVEQDLGAPDMAAITLLAGEPAMGQDVEVTARGPGGAASIFKGEVVGIEPLHDRDGAATGMLVHAMDRLHRLAGQARSRTFDHMSDGDIARAIAHEHGLSAEIAADVNVELNHVYQHNQTNLEFLRVRAAAAGHEVWVVDTTLHVAKRPAGQTVAAACGDSTVDGAGAALLRFHPRLAGVTTVGKVIVRGWDPRGAQEIVGEASAPVINLGAAGAALRSPAALEFAVDKPIASTEEASSLAAAKLEELSMDNRSAEAEVMGHATIAAGATIGVAGTAGRFDGNYLVTGASHRLDYLPPGYRTLLSLTRTDGGLFMLPEVDDEVLVAFEQGDPARPFVGSSPFVVGSLWDGSETPAEQPVCRSTASEAPASDRYGR